MNSDYGVGGAITGILIAFSFWVIPSPNHPITDAPWHWIHVYCNHALLWVHADQAEGCHPGPISPHYMSYYRMLAEYPWYQVLLNSIPYTLPVIAVILIIIAIPKRLRKKPYLVNRFFMPGVVVACVIGLTATYYFADDIFQNPGYCVHENGTHSYYRMPCSEGG